MIIVGWALAASTLAARAQSSGQPQFTDLGTLGSLTATRAHAMSADGAVIVGHAYQGNVSRAFRWERGPGGTGSMSDLGMPPGGIIAEARGISANGAVIVGLFRTAQGNRAFRWTASTGMVDLGVPVNADQTRAVAVSADGNTIAATLQVGSVTRGARWTPATGFQELTPLSSGGPYMEYASAVSADGTMIVGGANVSDNRAVRWRVGVGAEYLPVLPGARWSGAYDITASGDAIVGACRNQITAFAVRWTSAGIQSLGLLPTGSFSSGTVLSDNANAIGGEADTLLFRGPFFWTQALGMVELQTYLPSQGVDLRSRLLQTIDAMSADGTIIAGSSIVAGIERSWTVSGLPVACGIDFNNSGQVTRQDIFDFLAAYFSADPRADFNNSGLVSVQDVFSFLAAWFAGC